MLLQNKFLVTISKLVAIKTRPDTRCGREEAVMSLGKGSAAQKYDYRISSNQRPPPSFGKFYNSTLLFISLKIIDRLYKCTVFYLFFYLSNFIRGVFSLATFKSIRNQLQGDFEVSIGLNERDQICIKEKQILMMIQCKL